MIEQASVHPGKSRFSNTRKSGHLGAHNEKRGVTAQRRPRATGSTWEGTRFLPAGAGDSARVPSAHASGNSLIRPTVAKPSCWRYGTSVPAKSGAGCASPIKQKAHKRPKTIAGALFSPVMSLYGGRAWEGFGPAGFLLPRSCTPTHGCHPSCASDGGSSYQAKGAVPMKHHPARNPSAIRERAQAHRALALSALRADSSLSVRLRRYNAAMTRARALEAIAERLEATTTRSPRTALSWLQSGQSVHIDAVNLRDHLRHVRALATLEAVGGEA